MCNSRSEEAAEGCRHLTQPLLVNLRITIDAIYGITKV